MKKLFNKPNSPVVVCIIALVVMLAVIVSLIAIHASAEANLARQQKWTSDKDSFDRAYEIAASDKETPDKVLYIPNIVNLLGKTIDEAVNSIGQDAFVVSSTKISDYETGASNQTIINLNNEQANIKSGTPNIVADTNRSGRIVKISFSCNIRLLGYGNYSFVDLVDNLHLIERSYNEAGLYLEDGSVSVPANRSAYSTYDSDGTTLISENCDFNGNHWQDGRNFK